MTPPAAVTSAAPGSQSQDRVSACSQTPSRPAATAASSTDPDPMIRTDAAPAIDAEQAVPQRQITDPGRVQVGRDGHLGERPVGQPGQRHAVQRGRQVPAADPQFVGGGLDRSRRAPGARRRAGRAPSTRPAARRRSCRCRRPDRSPRCAGPGAAAPSSPMMPSSGRATASRPTIIASAALSASETTSLMLVLRSTVRPSQPHPGGQPAGRRDQRTGQFGVGQARRPVTRRQRRPRASAHRDTAHRSPP